MIDRRTVIIFIVALVTLAGYRMQEAKPAPAYAPESLLRFHVIANSDTEKDQQLKMAVRDAILERLGEQLGSATDLAEARKIAKRQLPLMEQVAGEVVKQWGGDYSVKAELGYFQFPTKSYGYFTLPAGTYEAVRVVIGQGEGQNWWCVLFPPLCFVDVSKSIATGPGIRPVVQSMDYDPQDQKVHIRFKLLEFLGLTKRPGLNVWQQKESY